jgi:hypothetical protein
MTSPKLFSLVQALANTAQHTPCRIRINTTHAQWISNTRTESRSQPSAQTASSVQYLEIFRTPSGKVDPLQSIIEPITSDPSGIAHRLQNSNNRALTCKVIRRFCIHCLVCSQVRTSSAKLIHCDTASSNPIVISSFLLSAIPLPCCLTGSTPGVNIPRLSSRRLAYSALCEKCARPDEWLNSDAVAAVVLGC